MSRVFAVLLVLLAACPAQAETLQGPARAIDGDTLVIGKTHIRLQGIDAPELHQLCDNSGRMWKCGLAAKNQLKKMVAGDRLRCEVETRDKYGRSVAECFDTSGSINRRMVARGWAVAYRKYSEAFVAEEAEAEAARRGIWDSRFRRPDIWRHSE